ncbi:MAG: SEC-C domain-containing protein, partial [Deltaproteobacteria bacterium]|nr:SEC-C domain-containing protein [Deltaproteobacteria bacterium]
GVPFNVLNAKQHEREAIIVAQAGRKGSITISTNMAGRGTDIMLGGNPEFMAKRELELKSAEVEDGGAPFRDAQGGIDEDSDEYKETLARYVKQCEEEKAEVLALGGLRIVGTERHESRRIDNQLRGRAGRQGDPGSSRFYLSLEDDLMRIFGADRITGLMERLGMEEDVPIEHSWVTKAVENAQKKVEGSNFDSRKNVLEYDDVMNQQRKTIYGLRRQILKGEYIPTLSEDDEKAGKVAEAATESGSWTIDGLAEELREGLTETIKTWKQYAEDHPELRDDNDNGIADEDEDFEDESDFSETPTADQPAWRQLRHDIWRQTGAWCPRLTGRLFEGPEDKLIDYVVDTVARSQIQQRERVLDLSDTVLGMAIDQHMPPNAHEDEWDMDGLQDVLREHFALDIEIPTGIDRQELVQQVWEAIEARIDNREEELTRPWFMYFSRHFYLEEIDKQWIDHLTVMDHLRQGIGLRGYGQKDPKKEYKKEGFDLFAEMMANIQQNMSSKIFRVEIRREEDEIPELQARNREMHEHHQSAATSGSDASVYGDAADGSKTQVKKQQTVRRSQPKVGRNDPCPCGSGKKYKKCHGRAGAEAQM